MGDQNQDDVPGLLKKTIGMLLGMGKNVDNMQQQIAAANARMDSLAKPPSDKPKDPTPEELDAMDRGTYTKWLIDKMNTEVVNPLKQQLLEQKSEVTKNDVATQAKEAASKYPDFWEFKDEIQAILNESPGLSINDSYHLARARHPEKASTLDAARQKEKEEEEKKKAEAEAAATPRPFGGILPTQITASSKTKLTPSQAVEQAWSETFGGENKHLLDQMQQVN